jgi:hypothetical protein
MSPRTRLRNRRPGLTTDLRVGTLSAKATIGFDQAGRPKELFLVGSKPGSDLAFLLEDAAISISISLQHGISARALAASMSRVPSASGAAPHPASLIAAALDLVAEFELEASFAEEGAL